MHIIGHNPSTADADKDDPTIRRDISFAKRDGFGGIVKTNKYSFRETCPEKLFEVDDPVGPDNLYWIEKFLAPPVGRVVAAWGAIKGPHTDSLFDLHKLLSNQELYCLGTTKMGHPRHPLYVKGDKEFERFTWVME